MRLGVLILILVATLFGSGFWYNQIEGACRLPLEYRIGEVDKRFGTSKDELRAIAYRAERIWESELQKDIFTYDEDARLAINLIFDERQEISEQEAELRQDLEAKEGMSAEVAALYEVLITEYRRLRDQYETRVIAYENSLDGYNAKVALWNDRGGATGDVVERLNSEKETLATEYEELDVLTDKLNDIANELNKIGARGNTLIADYNSVVESYNTQFGESHEFTQGDYDSGEINIYQFNTEDELTIVLAHEFGHALSIEHVEGEQSIMYHLMEAQSVDLGITREDMEAFENTCKEEEGILRLIQTISKLF